MVLNFHFALCRERTWHQNKDRKTWCDIAVLHFCLYKIHNLTRLNNVWRSLLLQLSYTSPSCFLSSLPAEVLCFGSRSLRLAVEAEELQALPDNLTHSVKSVSGFSVSYLLSASIPSSFHLLGSRNCVSPCKGASSIP